MEESGVFGIGSIRNVETGDESREGSSSGTEN